MPSEGRATELLSDCHGLRVRGSSGVFYDGQALQSKTTNNIAIWMAQVYDERSIRKSNRHGLSPNRSGGPERRVTKLGLPTRYCNRTSLLMQKISIRHTCEDEPRRTYCRGHSGRATSGNTNNVLSRPERNLLSTGLDFREDILYSWQVASTPRR